jgi:hypothetical protein
MGERGRWNAHTHQPSAYVCDLETAIPLPPQAQGTRGLVFQSHWLTALPFFGIYRGVKESPLYARGGLEHSGHSHGRHGEEASSLLERARRVTLITPTSSTDQLFISRLLACWGRYVLAYLVCVTLSVLLELFPPNETRWCILLNYMVFYASSWPYYRH